MFTVGDGFLEFSVDGEEDLCALGSVDEKRWRGDLSCIFLCELGEFCLDFSDRIRVFLDHSLDSSW